MCGRYNMTSAPEQVRALFRYPEQPNFPPRHNIAPTQPIAIVRIAEGRRQFALVRWGLIPPWVKDPRSFALLINARAESVNEKPAFSNAMKRRRCLIPADGFYEWKSEGGRKRPFVARPKAGGAQGTLIAFAGLWETWTGPNGEEMETAAIITTEANKEMGAVHHRAPVIVPPEQFDFWLDCVNVNEKEAVSLFRPAPDGAMEVYEISPAVNRVENDSPQLLEPYDGSAEPLPASADKPRPVRKPRATADSGQGSLF
jgi:putative SOS response-associated peptidase YedK